MQGRSEHSFTEQSFSVDINGARLYQESFALPSALQNESSRSSSDESIELMRSSPPKQQLQLPNTTTSPIPSAPWSFDDPMPTHLPFDEPFNCSDQRAKVRKEKLGDRITALQQLVSPFGKVKLPLSMSCIEFSAYEEWPSNPASKGSDCTTLLVRYRCIRYCVLILLAIADAWMQSLDKPKHCQGPEEEDLRSRGLCLVPVSATFGVARETAMDFWTPFLGGIKL
ncbi:hypothetical protein GW17_00010875 [Ensete ventricosum]|nr:hypothetical protein GW17_00010875 [Ensete ventricosum]